LGHRLKATEQPIDTGTVAASGSSTCSACPPTCVKTSFSWRFLERGKNWRRKAAGERGRNSDFAEPASAETESWAPRSRACKSSRDVASWDHPFTESIRLPSHRHAGGLGAPDGMQGRRSRRREQRACWSNSHSPASGVVTMPRNGPNRAGVPGPNGLGFITGQDHDVGMEGIFYERDLE